jgi:hypothetical protein
MKPLVSSCVNIAAFSNVCARIQQQNENAQST